MPRIALVTDSSACLPPGTAERAGVRVLPIAIRLPDADLHDGMPEASTLVYEALRAGREVKSAAPSPVEYLEAVEEGPGPALIITPATEFTGMHRSALAAVELASRPVAVLDSRTAAAAQGLVVLAAAEAAGEGADLDRVLGAAEDAARRADLVAAVDGVDHIRRSGRVPPFALDLARRLGVRPVFRFHDGTVERLGVPRSEDGVLRRIHREWRSAGGPHADRTVVFHAAAPSRMRDLLRTLGRDAVETEFSPSMGIHTGPGVVGVAWLRPRD